MKPIVLAVSAALALSACSNGEEAAREDVPAVEVVADAQGVTIRDAYIMPPFKGRDVAAGFFVAENNGSDDRLVAAASPIAETVEIHTHSEVDGVMAMRQIDGVDIPAGGTVEFRPGGYHLMLFGVELAEDVTETSVTLTYYSGREETLTVPIQR